MTATAAPDVRVPERCKAATAREGRGPAFDAYAVLDQAVHAELARMTAGPATSALRAAWLGRKDSEYLRQLFLSSDLTEGRFHAGGTAIAFSDIRAPMLVVVTEDDHVALWRSVCKIQLCTNTELSFVLTSGGHHAGIVSEHGHRGRQLRIAGAARVATYCDQSGRFAQTAPQDGSWRVEISAWLSVRSGEGGPARQMGAASGKCAVERDAPGTVVTQAMDTTVPLLIGPSRLAEPLMAKVGTILIMTCCGHEKVVSHDNSTDRVGAAPEGKMHSPAVGRAPNQIRVHAVSPGPLHTSASSCGRPSFLPVRLNWTGPVSRYCQRSKPAIAAPDRRLMPQERAVWLIGGRSPAGCPTDRSLGTMPSLQRQRARSWPGTRISWWHPITLTCKDVATSGQSASHHGTA